MFRPLLGHLQALWENRSKSFLYFNALWDSVHILFRFLNTWKVAKREQHITTDPEK